uniref:Protein kinase domain-containing protein n=1 Tax=Nothobranchius furzeri TaxID=105023 RepID=A0A8C6LXE6_NOTFU
SSILHKALAGCLKRLKNTHGIQEGRFRKVMLEKGVKIIDQSNVYQIEELRGYGAFGKVFKCRKEQTGETVAVKVFNKIRRNSARLELRAYKELSVLESDKNNLIRFFDSFIYKDHTFLVFEHLDVNLNELVKRHNKILSVAEIRPIAEQLLVSLRALKSIGLTHTDIKPDNMMLVHSDSKPFKVKLIDFGIAIKTAKIVSTSLMQPKGYRAPEVHLGLPRDEGIDMWGLGCVLVFLFIGSHLFPLNEYESMRLIVKWMGLPVNSMLENGMGRPNKLHHHLKSLNDLVIMKPYFKSPTERADENDFINLLRKMLALNPADRIHPEDALKHKFITMEHLPGSSSDTHGKPTESHITDQDYVSTPSTLTISEAIFHR